MIKPGIISLIVFLLIFTACSNTGEQKDNDADLPELRNNTIISGYEIIWGMDFLPDGDLIFTERKGNIYRKSNDTVTRLSGFPQVRAKNQGGLLDIKVHPDYGNNGWIYASYSADGPGGEGQLRLIRFRISGDRITDIEEIFSTDASNTWDGHYGSRIEFDNMNHLFLSIGEGGSTTYAGPNKKNNNAQELSSAWGKIHRLLDDGKIPGDNPVFEGSQQPSSIYSYGHRNPQGMVFSDASNELYITEHGPKGGDEINIVEKEANYDGPTIHLGLIMTEFPSQMTIMPEVSPGRSFPGRHLSVHAV